MNEGLDSGTDAASGFAAGTRTAPSYACHRRRHAELRAHNCHDSMAQIHEFSLRPNCWCARDGVRSYTNYTGPRRGAARTARKVRIEVGVTLRERAATRPARPHDVSPTVGNTHPRLIVRTRYRASIFRPFGRRGRRLRTPRARLTGRKRYRRLSRPVSRPRRPRGRRPVVSGAGPCRRRDRACAMWHCAAGDRGSGGRLGPPTAAPAGILAIAPLPPRARDVRARGRARAGPRPRPRGASAMTDVAKRNEAAGRRPRAARRAPMRGRRARGGRRCLEKRYKRGITADMLEPGPRLAPSHHRAMTDQVRYSFCTVAVAVSARAWRAAWTRRKRSTHDTRHQDAGRTQEDLHTPGNPSEANP